MKKIFKRAFLIWIILNCVSFFIISKFIVLEGTNIGSWILLTNIIVTIFIIKQCRPKLESYKANLISNNRQTKSNYNDEFFTLWESKKPIEITFKADHEPRTISHNVIRYAISPKGYHKIFYINKERQIIKVDEDDIETKFLYKGKHYSLFIEILEKIISEEELYLLREKEERFFEELSERMEQERLKAEKEYQAREDSKRIIYPFPPKELKFSIYGDYFDSNLPPNHLRITLLCDGLYGYPDTKEVLALTGIYAQTGARVNIRINAIVTMIGFDDKKYSREEFLALAKTFNQ
nr:MAG TPA: hypothetical protein [Caudoviricetes sp.]